MFAAEGELIGGLKGFVERCKGCVGSSDILSVEMGALVEPFKGVFAGGRKNEFMLVEWSWCFVVYG